MKTINLTQSQVAIVDDELFNWLNQWKWSAQKAKYYFYAVRCDKNSHIFLMHKEIFKFVYHKDFEIIIHKDKNSLDNQLHNLKSCTPSQQAGHQRKTIEITSSIYKGVSWNKYHKKWVSNIKVNYRKKHLGYYEIEENAARAYDEAALKYFGEFAWLNFPEVN